MLPRVQFQPTQTTSIPLPLSDAASDYGSDFSSDEELLVTELLAKFSPRGGRETSERTVSVIDIEDDGLHRLLSVEQARQRVEESSEACQAVQSREFARAGSVTASSSHEHDHTRTSTEKDSPASGPTHLEPSLPDPNLSPLLRFRSSPRKGLSVSDLTSPAWCELQHHYVLTSPTGRRRRTHAMRQGSSIHKTKEEEVHTLVEIDVTTKEDAWGLRLWNVVLGLRTLRERGLTREMPVWGVVEGEVVSGVIDELSTECPDPELDARIAERGLRESDPSDKTSATTLEESQMTLDTFLNPGNSRSFAQAASVRPAASYSSSQPTKPPPSQSQSSVSDVPTPSTTTNKIYLSDLKTRASRSLPGQTSFSPTMMQLMLYHQLLSNLIDGRFDPDTLFSRYELDAERPFSTGVVEQIRSLHSDADGSPSPVSTAGADDAMPQNLNALYAHLVVVLQATFPEGSGHTLSPILTAKYISQSPADSSSLSDADSHPALLGQKSFENAPGQLSAHLRRMMLWWKGLRAARGVDVHEAWKCRSCDFASGCTWRIRMDGEWGSGRRGTRSQSIV
ncbi:MAG: hypothetical protein M1817_001924 [Caeruleum heppii]|nr:MAG: hypothetical protein M1817_001924 [Caeruleum heppii]